MKLYNTGEAVSLSLKLWDGRLDKFVRATVFRGSTLLSSYSLNPIFSGFYNLDVSLTDGVYQVVYEVFKDAEFTKKDPLYSDGEEFIRVDNLRDFITAKFTDTMDNIDGGEGRVS